MEAVAELNEDDNQYVEDSKAAFSQRNGLGETTNNITPHAVADAKDSGDQNRTLGAKDFKMSSASSSTILEDKEEYEADAKLEDLSPKRKIDYSNRRCTLTCCAPDGSPLQGKSFIIANDGATMGRKHTNAIPLYMKITDT